MSALAAALERNAARRQQHVKQEEDPHQQAARSFLAETAPLAGGSTPTTSNNALSSSSASVFRPSSSTSASANSSSSLFGSTMPSPARGGAGGGGGMGLGLGLGSGSHSNLTSSTPYGETEQYLRDEIARLETELARLQTESSGPSRRAMGVPEVDSTDIRIEGEKVAQGGFSVLYKGVWRGMEVAIKKPVDPRVAMEPKLREEFNHEVSLLGEIRHPNIVLLVAACLRPPKLCIVFEWMEGGSLFDYLHNSTGRFERQEIKTISLCIAKGLYFLHSCVPPLIHRDVKTHNVLIDRNLSLAKLCDFGLATPQTLAPSVRAGQGTPMYMAPELFRGEVCRVESDVYSFGVTLLEMVARTVPFGHLSLEQIQAKVLANERPAIPLTCPRKATEIITQCWHADSSRRPRMDVVIGLLADY